MKKHYHIIGIGGAGLSAIAKILLEKGFTVSGSDISVSSYFDALTKAGITTHIGHNPMNIEGADIVIRSSAIPDSNPEVVAARAKGLPVYKRADVLEQIIGEKKTLAIAGSHGKTTTTAMVIFLLKELGCDPSFILGAKIKNFQTNASTGKGLNFVIEADEYDYMFLGLKPDIGLITNIEHDHPDCFPTKEDYLQAFNKFYQKIKSNGHLIICSDNQGNQELINLLGEEKKVLTYGCSGDSDYYAKNISVDSKGISCFTFVVKETNEYHQEFKPCYLNLPGMHNICNAIGALSIIHQLNLSVEKAISALSSFLGTERRFDVHETSKGIYIIDDYAHHPTQIKNTLNGTYEYFPNSRVFVVWEPHTYSRTESLLNSFVDAFTGAEKIIVTDIYAAREQDTGFRSEQIVKRMPDGKAIYIAAYDEICSFLQSELKKGDVVIVMSAGFGPLISKKLKELLDQGEKNEH